ncbi:MAG: hypothetical protein OXH84_04540 [Gammaproteobacteria bacterium]|nr:hypothetical protein [Gammaproteobacteria bacterium]
MSETDKKLPWFGIVVIFLLVCGFIAAITFLSINRVGNKEIDTENANLSLSNPKSENDLSELIHDVRLGSSDGSATTLVLQKPQLSDIVHYCPDPSTDPTDTCWQYLDLHFSIVRTGAKKWRWIDHRDHITLQSIFTDPLGDRQKVIDALNDPGCMLADASDFRWNLSDQCNATAFVNFRQLHRWCADPWYYATLIDDWFKTEKIERLNFQLPSKFDSHRKGIKHMNPKGSYLRVQGLSDLWADVLESRWIVKQCENFEVQKTIREFEHDSYHLDRLQEIGLRLGLEQDVFSGEVSLDDALKEIAVYFGNISAIINYQGSPEWLAYRDEQHPWIKSNLELFETTSNRMEIMRKGIQTAMELEHSNIDYDLTLVVLHICTYQTTEDPDSSCQSTIDTLRKAFKPSEWSKHQILDRIERIALDAGIYYDRSIDIQFSR